VFVDRRQTEGDFKEVGYIRARGSKGSDKKIIVLKFFAILAKFC